MRFLWSFPAWGVAAVIAPAPAAAVELDASATVLSDYRFRGISLSDRQPVVEAGADATLGAWFAGAEAIGTARGRNPLFDSRRTVEVDVSAGWSRAFGLVTPAAGVIGYIHPGGGAAASGEAFASVAGALGPATLTIGANYAPGQAEAPRGDLYTFVRAAAGIPGTAFTLHTSVGREAGAFAGRRVKLDYSGGIEARVLHVVIVGLDYVGNDLPPTAAGRLQRDREDGVVVRAGVRF